MSVKECAHEFVDAENVVEVCRCKDCKYANENKAFGDMYDCRLYRDLRKGTDFCNDGRRKS
jgi:hypothetical protein